MNFYKSPEWRALRILVIRILGPECACCHKIIKKSGDLHVDHVKPKYKFPELQLSITNMQILCEYCNVVVKFKKSTDYRTTQQIATEKSRATRKSIIRKHKQKLECERQATAKSRVGRQDWYNIRHKNPQSN